MSDLIERQTAIDTANEECFEFRCIFARIEEKLKALSSAQLESTRKFVELVVEYPDPELCIYKEYEGKPYYSIKYIENGKTYVGYGTYNPKVLSQYLKEYFISSARPEIIRCKNCKYMMEHDDTDGNVPYWTCSEWDSGTDYNGFCHYAERKTDD